MSTGQSWFNPQNIILAILFSVLLVVCFFYYQSLSSPTPRAIPASVKADILTQDNTQKKTTQATATKRLTPVTPEEKRVVEEKEYLQNIVDAGDQKINDLHAEEMALHEKDEQAKSAIAKLNAQVKGLSK